MASGNSDLLTLLDRLGLQDLAAAFEEFGIDDDLLHDLTEDDLCEIGLNLGQRKKLMKVLRARREESIQPAPLAAGAADQLEARRVSILFCDLVGSTRLAQQVGADELVEILRDYYRIVGDCVRRYGGHVSSLQGDGAVAVFGYPLAKTGGAERAIHSALDILSRLETYRPGSDFYRDLTLTARIGVASGPVVVGATRDGVLKEELHIVGAVPNRSARLQSEAAPGIVIVDEETHRQTKTAFDFDDRVLLQLKGFDAPQPAWTVLRQKYTGPAPDADAPQTPVIGRVSEFAILAEAWHAARSGNAPPLVITGDAGLGKTTLTNALINICQAEGARVLRLASHPTSRFTPFSPIVEWLEQRIGNTEPASQRRNALRRALPGTSEQELDEIGTLIDLQPIDTASDTSTAQRRELLFAALLHWLVGPPDRPSLIIIEDLHWTDPTTRELLDATAATCSASGAPVMLLGSSRDQQEPQWREISERRFLRLSPLPEESAVALIRTLSPEGFLSASVQTSLIRRGAGNPLMLQQLVRSAQGRTSGQKPEDAPMPTTIYESIAERLDTLRDARDVAMAAAVFGLSCRRQDLCATLGLPAAEVDAALEQLAEAGVVTLAGPDGTVSFSHALFREVLDDRLIGTGRRALHAAAARTLQEIAPDEASRRPDQLARLLFEAHDFAAAAPFALRAGVAAAERSSLIEADHHLRQTLTALDKLPSNRETKTMRTQALSVLAGVERARHSIASDEAGALSRELLTLARELGDHMAELVALNGLYAHALVGANYRAAGLFADDILAASERLGDATFRIIAHRAAGAVALHQGRFQSAIEHLRSALRGYDAERHRHLAHTHGFDHAEICTVFLAYALWMHGDLVGAEQASRSAVNHARSIDHPNSLAQALSFRTMLAALAHSCEAATEAGDEAELVGGTYDLKWMMQAGRCFRGLAHAMTANEPPDAVTLLHLDREHQKFRELNPYNYVPLSHVMLAEVCMRAGKLDAVASHIAIARETEQKTDEIWTRTEIDRVAALLIALRDGPAAGLRAQLDAYEQARRGGAASIALRIACDIAEAAPSEAASARLDEAAAAMVSLDDGWDAKRLARLRRQREPTPRKTASFPATKRA